MHAAGKTFGKFCLKATRYLFFQYVVCDQERDRGYQFFGGLYIQKKRKVRTFGLAGIIVVHNPDGNCFVLMDLIPMSYDCETKNSRHRQNFNKTCV